MTQPILDTAKEKMTKTAALLRKELAALRAGRANPQLLDRITVDYYGTPTPLNQLGNISAPEARQLVIALWDPKLIPQVEKAILKSDLGMTPANDGKIIRLVVPELNEERRKELTKLVRKSCEESKVAVRAIRRDAVEQFQEAAQELGDYRGRPQAGGKRYPEGARQRHQGAGQNRRRQGKGDHVRLTLHLLGLPLEKAILPPAGCGRGAAH